MGSQTRAAPSPPRTANRLPSSLTTDCTGRRRVVIAPGSGATVVRSQARTVPSAAAVSRCRPSGPNATPVTWLPCTRNGVTGVPSACHTRAVPSLDPLAR